MEERWRKSSWSEGANNCVEVAFSGRLAAVRDSKNPAAGELRVQLADLLAAVQLAGSTADVKRIEETIARMTTVPERCRRAGVARVRFSGFPDR